MFPSQSDFPNHKFASSWGDLSPELVARSCLLLLQTPVSVQKKKNAVIPYSTFLVFLARASAALDVSRRDNGASCWDYQLDTYCR